MELAVSTSPAHMMLARKKNSWYTINNGNWSNPDIWLSNARAKHGLTLPLPGDDVYINHTVTLDTNVTVNNLYIPGKLKSINASLFLTINGDLQANGTMDFTGNTSTNINVLLYGYNNFVNGFIAGNSTITYTRAGDQQVMGLAYAHLVIYGTGIKYLTANTTVLGNLSVNDFMPDGAILECGQYDLTVNGNTSITFGYGNAHNFSKSGSGNITFIGSVNINSNIIFSSSITHVEFRGGFTGSGVGDNIIFNCPVKFTTNSQTMSARSVIFNNTVLLSGAITLTYNGTGVTYNGGLNGNDTNSTYINNGYTYIGFSFALPMATGIFNYQNYSTSILGYVFDGDYTLPYTSYPSLVIYGTGTKKLSGNTIVAGNLNVNDFQGYDSKLDCGNHDLTINGTTTVSGTGNAISDAGLLGTNCTITFIGACTMNTRNINYGANVTLEFRGGVVLNNWGSSTTLNCALNFTTNSQTLTASNVTFTGNINISGGITLTTNSNTSIHIGTINGNSSSDILKNIGIINYQNTIAPMTTGQLYCNQAPNTFIYALTGNQDIQVPSDPTPGYSNLTLQGSGLKKLLGNISVKGTYTLTSPAVLNLNGFNLSNP